MSNFVRTAIAAACLAASAGSMAATNVLPANWSVLSTSGNMGVLRAGSGWEGGASLASQASIVDGIFLPETTQWNSGSWWWDQDPSVNSSQVVTTIQLNQKFELDSFAVQADDNDTYRIEYWTGSSWQTAWDVPSVPSWGLVTRSSGALAPIVTDKLRFTATGGDNFYAVSEIQAFGVAAVPEPETYALMLGALGLVGFVARRRRSR